MFIYYRLQLVDTAQVAAWQAQVQALQRGLRDRHPGLQARLLCRPEQPVVDGWHTWMETYAWPENPCGVPMPLQQEIERAARTLLKPPGSAGTRHTEVFLPCA